MRILILIMTLLTCNYSWAIFNIPKVAEVNAVKLDVAKNADAIMKVNANLQSVINMQNQINAQVKAELDAKANASAIAGFNNKLEQINSTEKVGGDKTTTNDTEMVKQLIKSNEKTSEQLIKSYEQTIKILNDTYRAIIVVFITQVFVLLKMFVSKDAKLQKYFMDYISEDEEREDIINGKDKLK